MESFSGSSSRLEGRWGLLVVSWGIVLFVMVSDTSSVDVTSVLVLLGCSWDAVLGLWGAGWVAVGGAVDVSLLGDLHRSSAGSAATKWDSGTCCLLLSGF